VSAANENAPAGDRGARKVESHASKPQAAAGFNKDFEDRRNAAACFPNRDKTEAWQADFIGVTVVENLPKGLGQHLGTYCPQWANVLRS
jgi:hypothetical protein